MGRLKAFANTTVSLFKTQEELEKLLAKHRIAASRWTHFAETKELAGKVRFEFQWQRAKEAAPIGFRVEVEYKYAPGPRGGNAGTTREQAGRALFWYVKNLFDAVEYGIVQLEEAFMPHMLPAGESGPTLYEQLTPRLEALTMADLPPLLTSGR